MADNIGKLDAIYQKARKAFLEVPEITVDELRDLQAKEDVVLVDVRTPEEQAVSMIPGAVTVEHLEEHEQDYRGRALVAYCTIGGRSGRYADMMRRRGWRIYNLKGAILAWTQRGGDLAGPQGPTKRVHVHSPRFNLVGDGYEAVW